MGEESLTRRLKESAMHGRRNESGRAGGGEGGPRGRHDELICQRDYGGLSPDLKARGRSNEPTK